MGVAEMAGVVGVARVGRASRANGISSVSGTWHGDSRTMCGCECHCMIATVPIPSPSSPTPRDSADRELFVRQFSKLKIIQVYRQMRDQMAAMGPQGDPAIARIEREVSVDIRGV